MKQIGLSEQARRLIASQCAIYVPKGRLPRIVLLQKTCSGARFGLFFDQAGDDDTRVDCDGITFLAGPGLLDRYHGFDLDMHSFFFGKRILVTPRQDDKQCDCETKCNRYNEES